MPPIGPDGTVSDLVYLLMFDTNIVHPLPKNIEHLLVGMAGSVLPERPRNYHYHPTRPGVLPILVPNSYCVGGCRDPHRQQAIRRHDISTFRGLRSRGNVQSKSAESMLSDEMMR
jgi:hypothetical protein